MKARRLSRRDREILEEITAFDDWVRETQRYAAILLAEDPEDPTGRAHLREFTVDLATRAPSIFRAMAEDFATVAKKVQG
jgi:hypothetical protein